MVYIGNNGKAASVSSIKVGDADGKAQNVVGGWVGDENGKARRIWSLDRPMWKFTCQNGVNLHVSGSGLAIDYGDGVSESIGTQTNAYHVTHSYTDTKPHQVTLYGVLSYVRFWKDDEESAQNYLLYVDTPFPKNRIAGFSNTFWKCTSLASIPAGLFDNCPNVTNFNNTFDDCTAIASDVPELWDTAKWPNVTNHLACFSGCTNAANYADIPEGWK